MMETRNGLIQIMKTRNGLIQMMTMDKFTYQKKKKKVKGLLDKNFLVQTLMVALAEMKFY